MHVLVAADHVDAVADGRRADLVLRAGHGRLAGVAIRCRVILKRLSEIAAPDVGRASAHSVKLPVRWEINSNQANAETWEVATR